MPLKTHLPHLHTLLHPPRYLTSSLLTSLGGLLNGLDTSTIGPVTTMPSFTTSFGTLTPSLHGLLISSVLLPAILLSLIAGSLSDSLGRTQVIGYGALCFSLGAALEASATSLPMLILGRCVVGTGEGLFLSALVVYVCEISPPKKRGVLASIVQLFITFGLVLGFFTCYGTVNIASSWSWRLPLVLQSVIAAFLGIMSFIYLPESPRWLAYKGRREEALETWEVLGVSSAEREKESNTALAVEVDGGESATAKLGVLEMVKGTLKEYAGVFKKDARKPLLLGVFLMSMQQLSGIDGIIYYAPLLFEQAGLASSEAKFLASGVSAILIFVFTILALIMVDRWGRRASTIYGGAVLFACMALMGLLYGTDNVHASYGAGRWVVIVTIYIFAIVYSMTWAIGMKLFTSEIQPIATRATATSLAQSANCFTNFFVAFITPVLLAKSSSSIYFLFSGALIFTLSIIIVYMPETRGRDLESMNEAFGVLRAAETPVIRALKKFGSWIGRKTGTWESIRERRDETEGGIELEARG